MTARLTEKQMRDAERAKAFFQPAPPEVEIDDPDYGFDREEFIDRHRSGTVRIVMSGHRCADRFDEDGNEVPKCGRCTP